jgi:hypothetical protein
MPFIGLGCHTGRPQQTSAHPVKSPSAEPARPEPTPSPGAQTRAPAASELFSALSPDAREEIRKARVPVLVPADKALAAAAVVTTGEHWSAVSIRGAELTIAIHGSDVSHEAPAGASFPKATERVRGVSALIGRNEGILSVSWEEGGIAYSLDVECFRPFEDPRCTKNPYALSLVESLVRTEPP